MKKKCRGCGEYKDCSDYNANKLTKDGLRSRCRVCTLKQKAEWVLANPDKKRQQDKRYREKCKTKTHAHTDETVFRCPGCGETKEWDKYYKDCGKPNGRGSYCKICTDQKNDLWEKENRSKVLGYKAKWASANSDHVNEKRRQWYSDNPEKVAIYQKAYRENNRLLLNLRTRIRTYLFERGTNSETRKFIGCDDIFFREHIEKQFRDGMTWQNYGAGGWHIDHIRPCASFDLTDTEQAAKCFHYTNLQPLWAYENRSKGPVYNGVRYLRGGRVARGITNDTAETN